VVCVCGVSVVGVIQKMGVQNNGVFFVIGGHKKKNGGGGGGGGSGRETFVRGSQIYVARKHFLHVS